MTSKRAVDEGDLDLVRADEAGADDVDQVPCRQVLGEEQLAWPALETGEVERLALELDASGADARRPSTIGTNSSRRPILATIPVTGGWACSPGRAMTSSTRPDPLPVAAQQRAADDAGKVDDVGGHQS